MRRLFWLILLLGGYLWILTSGHDDFVLEKTKAVYELVTNWVSSADADFHVKKDKPRTRHNRWE
jgi:hypothetical protein